MVDGITTSESSQNAVKHEMIGMEEKTPPCSNGGNELCCLRVRRPTTRTLGAVVVDIVGNGRSLRTPTEVRRAIVYVLLAGRAGASAPAPDAVGTLTERPGPAGRPARGRPVLGTARGALAARGVDRCPENART
jgi:hypothetical protein